MYNDFQLTDNLSAKAMRQKFQSIQGLENKDIAEIYEKLAEQREFLATNNQDGEYDKIITKIDESLSELSGILDKTNAEKHPYKASNLRSFLARQQVSSHTLDKDNNTPPDNKNNEGVIAPNNDEKITTPPTEDNSNNSNEVDNDINNMDSSENLTQNADSLQNPNMSSKNIQSTHKRNFPMPGSILYRLSQSLFMKNREEKNTAYSTNHRDFARPPYPPHPHEPRCDPREKCVTNQLNILRLMLLFMTLRPNCRYLPRFCRIASTQLDILSEMVR